MRGSKGSAVKWSEQYATGVTQLDEQHKMLFRMSEDYREVLDQGMGERVYLAMLQSLDQYARGHFSEEERCMYRYQCPVAATNTEEHGQFVRALAAFRKRYVDAGFDRADARRVVDFVDAWLSDHIGRIDVQVKPCVERAGRP
jgi:hemerythrin